MPLCSVWMRRARSKPWIATQPILPLRPGLPERQTHDYERHRTTTLFAALNLTAGKVIAPCQPRHRHQEFLRFLKQIDSATDPALEAHLNSSSSTARPFRYALGYRSYITRKYSHFASFPKPISLEVLYWS